MTHELFRLPRASMRLTPGGLTRPLIPVLVALAGPGAGALSGQLPPADAAFAATAGSYTALARGAGAVGANPAALGLPGGPSWSLVVPALAVRSGMGPVELGEVTEFEGEVIPRNVKLAWLDRIEGEGRQRGRGAAELTGVAATVGPVGIQISTVGSATARLNPDAAELLLFGNAGRTGQARELRLDGSSLRGFAATTLGIGAGFPLRQTGAGTLSVGVTGKLSMGHAVLVGRDLGSRVTEDPVEVELDLPVLHTDFDAYDPNNGLGAGIDLGAAWEGGAWSAGLVVQNLFHAFEWKTERLVFRPGQALFDVEESESDFEPRPASAAPRELRREVEELTFDPRIHAGVAYRLTPTLTLTGEVQAQVGDRGLPVGPDRHLGLGVEWARSRFRLQAGGARVDDGAVLGAGVALELGPATLAGAGQIRRDGGDSAALWAFSLGFPGGAQAVREHGSRR